MSQLLVQVTTPVGDGEVPRTCEVAGSISVQAARGPLVSKSVNVKFGNSGPVVAAMFVTATTWRCVGQLDPGQPPGSTVNIAVTAQGIIQYPLTPPATGTGTEEVAATANLSVRIASRLCPGNLPLVLLPVRLETRFFTLANSVTELRVRVYPDKIHLDSHEPDLLPTENEWGKHYWEQDWHAGNDATARATAWGQLADRFGAARAAWIARVLQPTNARPTTSTAPDQSLNPAPTFPAVAVVTDGKDSAWRHAPQARLMPDRWIAVLKSGATTVQVTGRDIARPLYVGPDPNPQPPPPPATDDQLQVDPGMKWMVDFDEAEQKGMGLRITVPPAASGAGVDSLFVFGVAGSLGGDAARQLANLLDAHHYTDGLEFLRFGTPTNNTDERRAAATVDDPAHERSYAIEVAADVTALAAQSNTMRVGIALGLPATAIVPVLGRIGQAAECHELDMRSMNAALVAGGLGLLPEQHGGFRRHWTDPHHPGVGARSLCDPRAQWRSLSEPALRPPALWRAAGDVARPVETGGRPRPGFCLRLMAARSSHEVAQQYLASAPWRGVPSRPSHPLRTRCRSRRHHAYGCARQWLQRAHRARTSLSTALACLPGRGPGGNRLHRDARRRRGRHPAASRHCMASASRPDGRCRRSVGHHGAAGAGRRGVTLARTRAQLHRGAPGSDQHCGLDPGASRSGIADRYHQPAAASPSPCAVARVGRRCRADRCRRPEYGPGDAAA